MRRVLLGILIVPFLAASLMAQSFSVDEQRQGYAHRNDTTYFVFDPKLYNVPAVDRLVVTGAFRGWDQNMEVLDWQLIPTNGLTSPWVLAIPNPDFQTIPPSTPFKFRLNEGEWLEPPHQSPNAESGNLVFMKGLQPPSLRAELRGPKSVWAILGGDDVVRPLNAAAYRILDAQGQVIPVASVLPNTADEVLVTPAQPLDPKRVYFLEIPALGLRTHCSFDGWFRTLYSSKPLGANINEAGTETAFRVFAPRAEALRLYLYHNADDQDPYATHDLTVDADGVWETTLEADLHGVYYAFTAHGPDDPGNAFYETHPVYLSDPYARVNVDAFGKSRVWRRTQPATPLEGGIPPMEDVVAYEVHVQDFTDLLPVSDDLKGTLPAMTVPGLRNSRGEAIGFDYLRDLGVNTVHLMPVQEFLHYPDSVWQAAFRDDPYMQAQGISEENYQWGYRTTHAFAIETRYRQRGTEHGAQRAQFRDLVQAFHDAGMAVIVDLVFNHTGENMEGQHFLFNFNGLDMLYYYRTRWDEREETFKHIGPFGNETKSEDRPMVQRWIIDQCKHLIEEFGVDGFRIDLAGVTDKQTLQKLMKELGPEKIVYGEPWIPSADPAYKANPDWYWYKADAPLTFFQDDARNAFQGPPSSPKSKTTDRGWAGGNTALRPQVMQALTNSFAEEGDPNRGINYLDIHDDWALADRYALSDWDGRQGVDERPYKLAATLLMTSLGPVVMHGGTELMRSKGMAPLVELVKKHSMGATYIHGKRDTYNLRAPNQFRWETVGQTPEDGTPLHYRNMHAYWRGLIHFRRSPLGQPFRIGGIVPATGYYRWIAPDNAHLLGYVVDRKILVLVNTDAVAHTFEAVALPAGTWRMIANGDAVDHENGVDGPTLTAGPAQDLTVPAQTALVWVREP